MQKKQKEKIIRKI